MGNSRSVGQPSKSLCLQYLVRRSWKLVSPAREAATYDTDDCATDLSIAASRCSGCKRCAYHQELYLDSESDMAPNAEEDLLVTMARGPHSPKERLRPPTYNAEDYAIALRRWGRRALGTESNQGTLPSTCTSSSSGYASGNAGEMTLRQFTSLTELLNKLKADLRLAFPSFVQEFTSGPGEGISLLLETLRGIQLSQTATPSALAQAGQTRRPRARRAALDELGCVECLAACAERCPEAGRILAQAQPGLLALAVCLTSSLNRARILALQLLKRVCLTSGGHAAVSEAVSTLRLRYAEGGRFRFLAGALLAAKAAPALRVAGLGFLNAFLASAPSAQTRLYIQAEACEAGLEPRALQAWLEGEPTDDAEPMNELLRQEVRQWSRHCVDVEALQSRARRAEETCRALGKRVSALQRQLHKLQLERLAAASGPGTQAAEIEKKLSSSAEDEGISFSERSSSPEERATGADNDRETTIDDVIEELRIIVKDAEEELDDWNQLRQSARTEAAAPSRARQCLRSTEESARLDRGIAPAPSLKIQVPGAQSRLTAEEEKEDGESAIVPAIIHPQPPRRLPPCSVFLQPQLLAGPTSCGELLEACVDSEHEEEPLLLEDDGSDSLLSASRLNYQEAVEPATSRRRSLSHNEIKMETLADFEISETVLDERVAKSRGEAEYGNRNSNSLGSKQYSKCSKTVQRRTERRKYLRRCQSQEHMEPQDSCSLKSRGSGRGVIEQIRKFESLNSFDERRSLGIFDESASRLRRSESFHQTRASCTRDYCASSRGGSDSGLAYNETVEVIKAPSGQQEPQHKSMTKSLDRIDEGLDAMVDIVVSKARRQICRRLSNEERPLKTDSKHYRQRQRYPGEDLQPPTKYRHCQEEFSSKHIDLVDDNKYTSFFDPRKERNEYVERLMKANRAQNNDPKIFASRAHDVLGFGKNRFNAGKYSGNNHTQQPHQHQHQHQHQSPQQQQQQQQQQSPQQQMFVTKNTHRHVNTPTGLHSRGKVTDMLSGLY